MRHQTQSASRVKTHVLDCFEMQNKRTLQQQKGVKTTAAYWGDRKAIFSRSIYIYSLFLLSASVLHDEQLAYDQGKRVGTAKNRNK